MNTGTVRPRARPATWSISTSNPTKLIEIVEIGKQLLMTRGALTTFSHRQRRRQVLRHHPGACSWHSTRSWAALNVMGLARRPQSAILSAIIFNALIIVALIPLALRGVQLPRRRRRALLEPQPARLLASARLVAPRSRHGDRASSICSSPPSASLRSFKEENTVLART